MGSGIVVGVDGSAGSAQALRWAVEEAAAHGAPVEAVVVWSYLDQGVAGEAGPFDPEFGEADARDRLGEVVDAALGAGSGVRLRTVCDLPVPGLVEAAAGADLLVVGARGHGGFRDLLLGSVGDRVAQVSPVPVAVVRGPAPVVGGRVAVGVDGSERSSVALRWAAAEAARRRAPLAAVLAWHDDPLTAHQGRVARAHGGREARAAEALEAALDDEALADVEVERRLVRGGAARALLDAAGDAALVVVGARGLGRLFGGLLGSTARQVLHHAPVPVVVVPSPWEATA